MKSLNITDRARIFRVSVSCWSFLICGIGLAGCSTSKLYDEQWPPNRMKSSEYETFQNMRGGTNKKSILRDSRATDIESSLGVE